MSILFINACVRENSRTKQLAEHVLTKLPGEVCEVFLETAGIEPLRRENLKIRDAAIASENWEHPMFCWARQFRDAEEIVVAAPCWDLAFPSMLKTYFEAVTVSGVTFRYSNGNPRGMCKARRLIYVTTAGGPICADFGFPYVKTIAEGFYGIPETVIFKAENLDVDGMDVAAILQGAKSEIDRYFRRKESE